MTRAAVPVHVVVEASESDGRSVLILRVCGELDLASRDSVEPAIMSAVLSADALVLDLAELTFCDSNGIAMFCAVREKAAAEETPLAFRNVVGMVRQLFALSGVDTMFGLIE
jgi:anti-sigma B factor antagonist